MVGLASRGIARDAVERSLGTGYLERERWLPLDVERARRGFVGSCVEPSVANAFADSVTLHRKRSPIGSLRDYVQRLPIVDPTKLRVPTLVIYGEYEYGIPEEDPEGSEHRAMRWRENLSFVGAIAARRKEFVVLPHGGHSIYLERAHDAWLRRVEEFLLSLAGDGRK